MLLERLLVPRPELLLELWPAQTLQNRPRLGVPNRRDDLNITAMTGIGRCILTTPIDMIGVGTEVQQGSDGFCPIRASTGQKKRAAPHRIDRIHFKP